MRSFMYDARKRALRACKTSNLTECIRSGRPTWLDQSVWTRLILMHWVKDEFKLMSMKAKQSRDTPVNGKSSRHTGGSVPFEVTQKRLSEAKKWKVGFAELFDNTHQLPDGEFADDRAREKSIAYRSAMIEKYGPNEDDWPYIDDDIYLSSMGHPRKGRYYGLGCSGATTLRRRRTRTPRTSCSDEGSADVQHNAGFGVDLNEVMSHITEIHKCMDEFTQQMRTEVEERYAVASNADPAIVEEARRQNMLDIEAFKDEMRATMEDRFKALEDARHADEEAKEQVRVQQQKEWDDELMNRMRDIFRDELRRGQGCSQ